MTKLPVVPVDFALEYVPVHFPVAVSADAIGVVDAAVVVAGVLDDVAAVVLGVEFAAFEGEPLLEHAAVSDTANASAISVARALTRGR
jgi:hypothetical protein